jgi:hypothetical protein
MFHRLFVSHFIKRAAWRLYDLSRVPDSVQPGAPMPDDPPPILGTWKRLYTFVLCWLAVVILLFYAFTRFFA